MKNLSLLSRNLEIGGLSRDEILSAAADLGSFRMTVNLGLVKTSMLKLDPDRRASRWGVLELKQVGL